MIVNMRITKAKPTEIETYNSQNRSPPSLIDSAAGKIKGD